MGEANKSSSANSKFPRSLLTWSFWLGDYDYGALCIPTVPCISKRKRPSFFLGLDDKIPVLLAAVMGLQHALAVAVATTTFPRLIAGAGPGHLNLVPKDQAYLISVSLIVSGLLSMLSIIRIRLAYGYFLGSGLIVLSGTSLAFIGIAQESIKTLVEDGFCKEARPCPDAYALWLGTVLVGSLLVIAISFLRPRAIRRIFPPIVSGSTVLLLGASIVGMSMRYWAGGSGACRAQRTVQSLGGTASKELLLCPSPTAKMAFPWGDPHWIGLGFFVLIVIIIAEIFGSQFMQGTQVAIGLILGIILSAALGYLRTEFIKEAPVVTFLWTRWFGLGFYAPALLPVIVAYIVEAVDTVADITAACEASRVSSSGEEYESRIQGGLLADGLNSLLAGLMCGSPLTTYSINPPIIAVSQTANRSAGVWACFWLVVMGIFGKIGGLLVSVPDSVIGAVLGYLSAGMTLSGMRILCQLKWDRRDRFILSVALAIGLGIVIVPDAFNYFIPKVQSQALESLRQSALIILRNGFTAGALITIFLNLVLPQEKNEPEKETKDGTLEEDTVAPESERV